MKKWFGLLLLGCLTAVCVVWFSFLVIQAIEEASTRQGAARARGQRAAKATGDIHIGVPYPFEGAFPVRKGISLAVKEINSIGGIMGRRVRLVFKDDRGDAGTAGKVAQSFAGNPDIVAVVGHPYSEVAVHTAIMYEYPGILFISPVSMNSRLTSLGYKRVFRGNVTDEFYVRQVVALASREGYKRVAMYYRNDEYGRGMAAVFQREAEIYGVTVSATESYEPGQTKETFMRDMARLERDFSPEALFLVSFPQEAMEILPAFRESGSKAALIGAETLHDESLAESAGPAAEGMWVLSIFHQDLPFKETRDFVKAFEEFFKQRPQFYDAASYDSMKLLAHAIKEAGSTVPDRVADALRTIKDFPGVTGPRTVTEKGDILSPLYLLRIEKGRFRLMGPVDGTDQTTR